MRLLFLPQSYARQADELLTELGVCDVQVVLVARSEYAVPVEHGRTLHAHPDANVATVQVNKRYVKSIESLGVRVACERKEFRSEDPILRAWLSPPSGVSRHVDQLLPSQAFADASARQQRLHIVNGALNESNNLDPLRHPFCNNAAKALEAYASSGGSTGAGLADWFRGYQVDYAANGQVSFTYDAHLGSNHVRDRYSEWHLKQGDRTTREKAARVYFHNIRLEGDFHVIVFYCGPHPDDGNHHVQADLG